MKTISKFVLAFVATLLSASVASAQEIRVRTNFNTRLREAPSGTSLALATIPRRTTLVAEALSVDKAWIQVTFQGQKGWIATRLVDSWPLRRLALLALRLPSWPATGHWNSLALSPAWALSKPSTSPTSVRPSS